MNAKALARNMSEVFQLPILCGRIRLKSRNALDLKQKEKKIE